MPLSGNSFLNYETAFLSAGNNQHKEVETMNKISLLIIMMVSFVFAATVTAAKSHADDRSNAEFFYDEVSFCRMDASQSLTKNFAEEKENIEPAINDFSASEFFYGYSLFDPIEEIKIKPGTGFQMNRINTVESTIQMPSEDF